MYRNIRSPLEPLMSSWIAMDISGSTIMICGILMAIRNPERIGLLPRKVNLDST